MHNTREANEGGMSGIQSNYLTRIATLRRKGMIYRAKRLKMILVGRYHGGFRAIDLCLATSFEGVWCRLTA